MVVAAVAVVVVALCDLYSANPETVALVFCCLTRAIRSTNSVVYQSTNPHDCSVFTGINSFYRVFTTIVGTVHEVPNWCVLTFFFKTPEHLSNYGDEPNIFFCVQTTGPQTTKTPASL